jgi:hypothetical protein
MHRLKLSIDNNILAFLAICLIISSSFNISLSIMITNSRQPTPEGMSTRNGMVSLCSAEVPTITGATYHEQQQDYPYVYDFNATGESASEVVYTDNTSLFNITSDTGIVNFTPTNDDVGVYYVMITATETVCNSLHDEIHATFNITNRNDGPYLVSIVTENASSPGTNITYDFFPGPVPPDYLKIISGQVELWEDEQYNLSIIADDPDLYIPFSTEVLEYDAFGSGIFFVLDNDTGRATFTPVQAEVGSYQFTFNVDDGETADESAFIDFVVNNVNDAPVLENKTMLTITGADSGEPFYLDINATDEDGDTLTYGADFLECNQTFRNATSQNCTIFYINTSTGVIAFTPLLDEVGNYTMNYTVDDGNGGRDWHVGNFSVNELPNKAPNITSWVPYEYNVTIKEGHTITFNITVEDPETGTNTVSTSWYIDGRLMVQDVYSYTVSTNYDDSGVYNVTVVADDGHYQLPLTDWHEWRLIVLEDEPPRKGRRGMFAGEPCTENWRCTAWSECPKEGIQTRTCVDLSYCGTTLNQPPLTRHCIYTPSPTCFDGIENCHDGSCEVLTDCGGPCKPCPTCSDGIMNCHVTGVCEEGVDCGGPCKPCLEPPMVAVCGNEVCEAGELYACPEDCLDFWLDIMIFVLILVLLIITSILLYIYRKETVLLYVYRRVKGEDNA